MQPWCFPALNHVSRLLQNSCTQMKIWQTDAEARATNPCPSEPVEGHSREAACSWPESSLGWHRGRTYLHLHLSQIRGAKGAALISVPKSPMSLSEAPCRAPSGNPRMGLAAAAVTRAGSQCHPATAAAG